MRAARTTRKYGSWLVPAREGATRAVGSELVSDRTHAQTLPLRSLVL